jgi:hypothetical protein
MTITLIGTYDEEEDRTGLDLLCKSHAKTDAALALEVSRARKDLTIDLRGVSFERCGVDDSEARSDLAVVSTEIYKDDDYCCPVSDEFNLAVVHAAIKSALVVGRRWVQERGFGKKTASWTMRVRLAVDPCHQRHR